MQAAACCAGGGEARGEAGGWGASHVQPELLKVKEETADNATRRQRQRAVDADPDAVALRTSAHPEKVQVT